MEGFEEKMTIQTKYGRTAVVTGAAKGIGRETAARLAQCGVQVALADINEEKVQEAAEEIRAQGGACMAVRMDVTSAESVRRALNEIRSHFGPIDILVNNAGGPREWYNGKRAQTFLEMDEEGWRRCIELNLNAVFIVTKAVLPDMMERRSGKIINLGSVAGVNGKLRMVDYSAAKGGVISMTHALAMELGKYGICVNCVSPGSIASGHVAPMTFLKRSGRPEEVAQLILFLASSDSDFITGQNYLIDGGRNLGMHCPQDWLEEP